MSLVNSVIKAFVGDKSKRDVKAMWPMVEKIKAFGPELEALDHDGLRARTDAFASRSPRRAARSANG